jgi:hypothetical protein
VNRSGFPRTIQVTKPARPRVRPVVVFLERITLIHLSRAWINEPHPTYVSRGRK